MSSELKDAMDALEKEKNISRDVLLGAIENALMSACRNQFGKTDNIRIEMNPDDCSYKIFADKTVVGTQDEVIQPNEQIALEDATAIDPTAEVGSTVAVPVNSNSLGRIATTNARNVITQKIREEERISVYKYYSAMQKDVVTGVVQRRIGSNYSINLGRADGFLPEKEQVPGEHLRQNDRIKVYIVEVHNNTKDSKVPGTPRILVSRTHPELVKRLFEQEVAEIRDGTVEIRSIAREAGSRTKIAVWSNNPNVDPVGACVGVNGSRVSNIVDELHGEKIDIVNWDDNPGNLIQNALSPAKIVAVFADPEARTAKVVVPDYQLSLAIGREGQNARLAAKLTNYKIDIKSETQAKDAPGFRYEDYQEDGEGYEGDEDEEIEYVDENGNPVDKDGNPLPAEDGSEESAAETGDAAAEEIPSKEGEAAAEEAPAEGGDAADEKASDGQETPADAGN
ncbi:MAG: transcription termination factor NusA [Lachnospiraceae bacterium]|jgi:N utilization substance protein A|nr:transcription termination factor NusA [Lachnospiraceae bacterium]